VGLETATVEIANVADVAPAGTVTLAGTVADGLLSDSATSTPPVGAAAFRVTRPVEAVPPTTVAGVTATDDSATAGEEPPLVV
jgi:hypothetical protein